jgi:hypothetical protein
MAAIHQAPSRLRITTPPADISRTMIPQVSRITGVSHPLRRRGNTLVTRSRFARNSDGTNVLCSFPCGSGILHMYEVSGSPQAGDVGFR